MSTRRSVRGEWIAAAVGVILLVVVLAGTWQGACYDSGVEGGSSCSSGPILGWPATIAAAVAAVAFTIYALRRALR